jgi:AcrR family transcriptional regulator
MDLERCKRCKGRPRSEKAKEAILASTLRLLERRPLRRISVETIAGEACVGKATIYKWWPSKAQLALEAFLASANLNVTIPDTGSAKRDFVEQVRSLIRFFLTKQGGIFRQFLAESQSDPLFADAFRKLFLSPRREAVKAILRRGVARREIRGDLDTELVLDLIYGPLVYRLMAGHAPLDDGELERLVSALFEGIASH